jgi:short-subunit dehydrogenase
MNNFKERYGTWAMVAGAAEGLGEAWSRALAKRNVNLLMVDYKAESLSTLSKAIENEFSIETIQINIDLRQNDASSMLMEEIKKQDCRLLVYNAAYSRVIPFLDLDKNELDHFIDINCRTPLKLVHAFANRLKRNGPGGILLMSSLSGLIGMQLVAPYAATKAFSRNLAEGLHHELKQHNIDIMACIAGPISTPAYLETNPDYGTFKPSVMQPDDVAEKALDMLGRKTLFIPGFTNRLNYFILTRLMPRKWAAAMANRVMRKMYGRRLKPKNQSINLK